MLDGPFQENAQGSIVGAISRFKWGVALEYCPTQALKDGQLK